MVTISESNKPKFRHHTSSQLRYTITYVVVTVFVLAFLNLYCSQANEQLFKQSKYTSLLEKAQLTADEIAARGDVNIRNSSAVILRMSSRPSRVIVTDENSQVIYDSQYIILDKVSLPVEIADALDGDNAFSWEYRDGVITAAVAVPIYTIRGLSGCLYMMEVDTNDGALLKSLHTSILTITIVLGVFLVIFSIFYLHRYSRRLNKIMASMRIIQEGNYTHKIDMRGNDELSFLAEEFNYLTDRLQISENKRRQFVSDASHELKTPLASIKLLSDSILQYDMDMETVREFAGDIGNEADRLNRMTAKLLALTKDESNTANDEAEIILPGQPLQAPAVLGPADPWALRPGHRHLLPESQHAGPASHRPDLKGERGAGAGSLCRRRCRGGAGCAQGSGLRAPPLPSQATAAGALLHLAPLEGRPEPPSLPDG